MGIVVRLAPESEKQHARRIVEDQYLKQGYLPSGKKVFFDCMSDYESHSYTLVALENNSIIGTLTLIVDSPSGLPMDKIYDVENNQLRNKNRTLSELSQFAVKDGKLKSSLLLCKYARVLATNIMGCSDFVITVNPRHTSFYKRILKFSTFASEKDHPFLTSAKTIPLRLDLLTLESVYKKLSFVKRSLDLHDFFFGKDNQTIENELRVALQ